MALSLAFGADKAGWQVSSGSLVIRLPLPQLGGAQVETLLAGNLSLETISDDCVQAVSAPYQVVALKASVCDDLAATTRHLYGDLLRHMAGASLLRIWNFVPRINDWSAGEEQYRRFCTGRAQAFAADSDWAQDRFPAASAVGCYGDELIVYAMATREGQAVHYENPLQVPAYRYPQEYGPDAPAFSRATVDLSEHGAAYFVSGTAAVRGHATVHPSDIEGQLSVTAENLRAILAEIEGKLPAGTMANSPMVRAYVRRPEDAARVRSWMQDEGWAAPGQYTLVQADICREDLLVEVELSWFASHGAHALKPLAESSSFETSPR